MACVPPEAGDAARSSWHVLVSEQSCAIGFNNGGGLQAGLLEVVSPPVPLLSTSAPAIDDGPIRTKRGDRD